MPTIAVTAGSEREARRYCEAVRAWGACARLLTPAERGSPAALLDGAGGLLLCGGPDVHPSRYGQAPLPSANLELDPARDELEFGVLGEALARDMPVLAICRGMQLLNVALGGSLIQDLPHHKAETREGRWVSAYHRVFITPGSKLAQIVGAGGFARVNSRHHQGLRDAQRAPALLTSAYALDDHLVEGVESPQHGWVIGVQCHPERAEEVPRSFQQLFLALVERATEFAEG